MQLVSTIEPIKLFILKTQLECTSTSVGLSQSTNISSMYVHAVNHRWEKGNSPDVQTIRPAKFPAFCVKVTHSAFVPAVPHASLK